MMLSNDIKVGTEPKPFTFQQGLMEIKLGIWDFVLTGGQN